MPTFIEVKSEANQSIISEACVRLPTMLSSGLMCKHRKLSQPIDTIRNKWSIPLFRNHSDHAQAQRQARLMIAWIHWTATTQLTINHMRLRPCRCLAQRAYHNRLVPAQTSTQPLNDHAQGHGWALPGGVQCNHWDVWVYDGSPGKSNRGSRWERPCPASSPCLPFNFTSPSIQVNCLQVSSPSDQKSFMLMKENQCNSVSRFPSTRTTNHTGRANR